MNTETNKTASKTKNYYFLRHSFHYFLYELNYILNDSKILLMLSLLIFLPVSLDVLLMPSGRGGYFNLLLIMLISLFPSPIMLVLRIQNLLKKDETHFYSARLIGIFTTFSILTIIIPIICCLALFPFSSGQAGGIGGRDVEYSRFPLFGITLISVSQIFVLTFVILLARLPKYISILTTLIVSTIPIVGYFDLFLPSNSPLRRDETLLLTHLLAFFPLNMGMIHPNGFIIKAIFITSIQFISFLIISSAANQNKITKSRNILFRKIIYITSGVLLISCALYLQYTLSIEAIRLSNDFRTNFFNSFIE
jgi:hypothetical protein